MAKRQINKDERQARIDRFPERKGGLMTGQLTSGVVMWAGAGLSSGADVVG